MDKHRKSLHYIIYYHIIHYLIGNIIYLICKRVADGARGEPRSGGFIRCLAALSVSVALMGGCVSAPAAKPEQEVIRFEWVANDGQGREDGSAGRLSFSDGMARLSSERDGNGLDFCGEYFIDGKTITIVSQDTGTVVMNYELSGEKLILTYSGRTAELVKKTALQ